MVINAQNAFAFVSDTVSTTALTLEDMGFTAAEIAESSIAWMTNVSANDISYRIDGGTVIGGAGHLISTTDVTEIIGNTNLVKFNCIRTGASDGTIVITLFR